jgi:hypothetical protein
MDDVTFQVLTAMIVKVTVFWDAAPCSLVDNDRRFRGTYCLYYQGDDDGEVSTRLHGATSQKIAVFKRVEFFRKI